MNYKTLLLIAVMLLAVGCAPMQPESAQPQPIGADEDNIDTTSEEVAQMVDKMEEMAGKELDVEMEKPAVKEEDLAPEDWCVKGQTFSHEQDGASVDAVIQGFETYKGKEFCKGLHHQEMQGMSIDTTYYFNYGAQEMWVISSVMGQTTQMHIVDGKVVS